MEIVNRAFIFRRNLGKRFHLPFDEMDLTSAATVLVREIT